VLLIIRSAADPSFQPAFNGNRLSLLEADSSWQFGCFCGHCEISGFVLSLASAGDYNNRGWFADQVVRDIEHVPHLQIARPPSPAGITVAFKHDPESKTAGRSHVARETIVWVRNFT
jgi:hypothetical protein